MHCRHNLNTVSTNYPHTGQGSFKYMDGSERNTKQASQIQDGRNRVIHIVHIFRHSYAEESFLVSFHSFYL